MSNRIAAGELEQGMVLQMNSGAWIIERIESVATSTGPLVRLVTRGFRTGSRKPMTMGARHTVKVQPARAEVMA